jgi:hypothetical protein
LAILDGHSEGGKSAHLRIALQYGLHIQWPWFRLGPPDARKRDRQGRGEGQCFHVSLVGRVVPRSNDDMMLLGTVNIAV